MNNNQINICGVLVHARPEISRKVAEELHKLKGVEVHKNSQDGKLVVTVESDGNTDTTRTIDSFNDTKGVISTSLVYQHSE